MRSPSTLSVMSSQTQPQNVQVASSTILSVLLGLAQSHRTHRSVDSISTVCIRTHHVDFLQHDVQSLARRNAGAVRVGPHQPAGEVAIGDEKEAGRNMN